jgi:hypothetical protein
MAESMIPVPASERAASTSGDFGQKTSAAPSIAFGDPHEILDSDVLADAEKRALLASWASDSCAVEGMPAWRRLPRTGTLVSIDDILDALRVLDRGTLN